jgi:c-di-GMP-binding flagellar brake protein YcgR
LETRTKCGDRFPIQTHCQITINSNPTEPPIAAITQNISEGGACLWLQPNYRFSRNEILILNFSNISQPLSLPSQVIESKSNSKCTVLRVTFCDLISDQYLTLEQHRHLVQFLYTQIHEFQQPKLPTTIRATLAILQAVLILRPLMNDNQRT